MKKKLLCLLLAFVSTAAAVAHNYHLWYQRPAQTWTQALPVGNGVMGGMVFGLPAVERIQLNEETIWAGQPNQVLNPEAKENLPRVRQLLFEGRYAEAQELANQKVMPVGAGQNMGMPYQPFGDLHIAMPGHAAYTDYQRELDLSRARALVHYSVDGVRYEREISAPLGTKVIAVRLTASQKGKITFTASFTTPHADVLTGCLPPADGLGSGAVYLHGVSAKHENVKGKVRFMGLLSARCVGGSMSMADGQLTVTAADEAVVYVTVGTNVVDYQDISGDEQAQAMQRLTEAMVMGYDELMARHEEAYRRQSDRVQLDLGPDTFPTLPTDKRIEQFSSVDDPWFVANYFQFGRYLLISSSQPDNTNPANLQGIWNEKMLPSWDSKYTTNINLVVQRLVGFHRRKNDSRGAGVL